MARNLGYAVLIQRPKHDTTYEGLPLVIREIANPIPPLGVTFAWPKTIHLHRRVMAFVTFGANFFRNSSDEIEPSIDLNPRCAAQRSTTQQLGVG